MTETRVELGGNLEIGRASQEDLDSVWGRVGTDWAGKLAAPPFAASKLYGKYRQNSIFLSFKKYFEPTFFAMSARSWQLFSARAIFAHFCAQVMKFVTASIQFGLSDTNSFCLLTKLAFLSISSFFFLI